MSEAREVAKLAIMAAGPVGNDERGWNLRVAQFAMQIGALLREPGEDYQDLATTPTVVARKVLDADVYRGEFVSFSDEEMNKSHRLLVRIKPEHGKQKYLDADGCEWLRTEPRWTPAGFVMQRLIRTLVPTTPVLIYKYVESFTSRGEDDEDKKSRVLAHIEVTGRPRDPRQSEPRQSAPPAERAPTGGDAGGAQQPSAAAAPPATSNGNPAVTERFNALKPAQQVALARVCRSNGIDDFIAPEPDNLDKVLVWIGKLEKGEALT